MTDEAPAGPAMETIVVAFMGADGPAAVTQAILGHVHLKPMWERLRVGKAGGVDFVGLPIGNKVNDDSIENHSRHLHSLLRLLDLPFTNNYMDVTLIEVASDSLSLPPDPPPEPDAEA